MTITVRAVDPLDGQATTTFTVTVAASVNLPPVLANPFDDISLRDIDPPQTRDLAVTPIVFTDPNGNPLTYTATSSDVCVVTATISATVLTLTSVAPGVATISVEARDGRGGVASTTFTVTVEAVHIDHTELVFTQETTTAFTGIVMSRPLLVKAQDAAGDGAAGQAVTLELASGPGTLSGTLTGATDNKGVAAFVDLIYTAIADNEDFTIRANADDFQGNPISVATSAITSTISVPPTLNPISAAVPKTQENQKPLLTWDVVAVAGSYELDLGLLPTCENIADDLPVAGTSYPSPQLTDGSYCWRVRAVDVNGNKGIYSADSSFTAIPAIGAWGMVYLVVSTVGCGSWYMQRS